ncbi:MAG: GntR family transcriptional regulator [Planctomycetota bacterium]|nr:GntR family transcriptional regulator [Planctomycetota bacterium]
MKENAQYQQVADSLATSFKERGWRPGQQLPSVRELARTHGVSVFTVSKALKLLAVQGVVERRWGVGCFLSSKFHPARPPRREPVVGILLDPQRVPGSGWSQTLLEGFLAGIASEGARAKYVSWEPGLTVGPEIDGLLVGSYLPSGDARANWERIAAWLRMPIAGRFPVVCADFDFPGGDSVQIDNAGALAQAARYLVQLGHREIAYLSAPNSRTSKERLEGLREALREHGLAHDERLVWRITPSPHISYEQFPAFHAARQFTAICCYEDLSACGVIKAARERGLRVPEDLSVVGCGNLPLGEFANVPLTTLDVRTPALTKRAVRLLLDRIRGGGGEAEKIRVPAELIVRGSTGPCGA